MTPKALSGKEARQASECLKKAFSRLRTPPTEGWAHPSPRSTSQSYSPITKPQNQIFCEPHGWRSDISPSPCSGHLAAGQATDQICARRRCFSGLAQGPCAPCHRRPGCWPQAAAHPSGWHCRKTAPGWGPTSRGWGSAVAFHLMGTYQSHCMLGIRMDTRGNPMSKTLAALPGLPFFYRERVKYQNRT